MERWLARSLGYDIPDSTNYTLESWVPFERMIALMQPENMTDLMVELMPQMMAAMPAPLQSMMKMVKYVPGMDAIDEAHDANHDAEAHAGRSCPK